MIPKTNGFTLWARETIESDIFFYKPAAWFKIWFFIVSCANYKDGKLLKKGECFLTYDEIILYTKCSKSQVERCLRWLESKSRIETRRTTRGRVRFIVNYAKYQDVNIYRQELKRELSVDSRETSARVARGVDNKRKKTSKQENTRAHTREDLRNGKGKKESEITTREEMVEFYRKEDEKLKKEVEGRLKILNDKAIEKSKQ